tara:strand:- start:55 stop:183 length:129 start_codon:yes stop_codon:yes gene_type:complete
MDNNDQVKRTPEGEKLYNSLSKKDKQIIKEIRNKLLLIQRFN